MGNHRNTYNIIKFTVLSDDKEEILEWGHCLPSCPSEDIRPVCQILPIFPFMKDMEDGKSNYTTNIDSVTSLGNADVTLGVTIE